jgi:hypothetical protein
MKRVKMVRAGARSARVSTTGSTRVIQGVGHGPSGDKESLHIDADVACTRADRTLQLAHVSLARFCSRCMR